MAARARGGNASAVGMMEGAFFVPRTELIQWVNDLLQISLTKVEQCASGAVYCQIIDSLNPGSVAMRKVNWMAKADHEYIPNYKVLQAAFDRNGIQKHIDVDKLIRAKYQDNLEFLQWVKCHWEREGGRAIDYDAPAAREGRPVPAWARAIGTQLGSAPRAVATRSCSYPSAPLADARTRSSQKENLRPSLPDAGKKATEEITATVQPAQAPSRPLTTVAKPNALQGNSRIGSHTSDASTTSHRELEELRREVATANGELSDLQYTLQGLEKERDYYFRKLRDVETLCSRVKESANQDPAADKFADEVLTILYAEDEDDDVQE